MWRLDVGREIERQLSRLPTRDHARILAALDALSANPIAGNMRKLDDGRYRLRVGAYRVFYSLDRANQVIRISDVVRRTSTTY